MGEPYFLSIEQIKKLTPTQIRMIYFRPEDYDEDYSSRPMSQSEAFILRFTKQGYTRAEAVRLYKKLEENKTARQKERSKQSPPGRRPPRPNST